MKPDKVSRQTKVLPTTGEFMSENKNKGKGPAQAGDTVNVHYRGTLYYDTEFDSSYGSEPLEVVLGKGEVIPGFEDAIIGMRVGDKVTVEIQPDEAYGEPLDDLYLEIPREDIPSDIKPEIGQDVTLQTDDGPLDAVIVNITDEVVIIDANHPLAGEVLIFDIELVSIKV
jgi:peptidylprolyl isomerase